MNDLQKSPEFIAKEFYTKLGAIQEFYEGFSVMDKNFELLSPEEIHNYSWDDVMKFVNELIPELDDYNSLYGVPRGGLIIALILSYRSGLPIVSHPCPGCLVIEDACTTGASLIPYYERYSIACMYAKDDSPIEIDYLYDTDTAWKGVKFPWQL